MANESKTEGGKAKAWSADEKVDILMYMLDEFAPKLDWKKLENIPHGRTLKAVQVMFQREKARYSKGIERADTPTTKDYVTDSIQIGEPMTKAKMKALKKATPKKASEEDANEDNDDGEKVTKKRKAPAKKGTEKTSAKRAKIEDAVEDEDD